MSDPTHHHDGAFDPNAAASADAGVFGLPHTPAEARVVLIPVPFDATTSYKKGAADGPAAIFNASKQVDLFDIDTGKPYEGGIAMLDEDQEVRDWNDLGRRHAADVIEVGGNIGENQELRASLEKVNEVSAKVNDFVYEETKHWLERGKLVGIVGGDHAVPYGAIAAHAEKFGPIGVLHFDAHSDLRHEYEGFVWSHASIMDNVIQRIPSVIKLVQVGIRDFCEEEFDAVTGSKGRIEVFYDSKMRRDLHKGATWQSICDRIAAALPERVYVSFDIDGFDPALCPNTGTPVPGGLSFDQAVAVLDTLVERKKRIVGFDLNEVAPGQEGDEWDGNVGARLLYKLIGFALKSQ